MISGIKNVSFNGHCELHGERNVTDPDDFNQLIKSYIDLNTYVYRKLPENDFVDVTVQTPKSEDALPLIKIDYTPADEKGVKGETKSLGFYDFNDFLNTDTTLYAITSRMSQWREQFLKSQATTTKTSDLTFTSTNKLDKLA